SVSFAGTINAGLGGFLQYGTSTGECGSSPATGVTLRDSGTLIIYCDTDIAALDSEGEVRLSSQNVIDPVLSILGAGQHVINGTIDFGFEGGLECCVVGGEVLTSAIASGTGRATLRRGTWTLLG